MLCGDMKAIIFNKCVRYGSLEVWLEDWMDGGLRLHQLALERCSRAAKPPSCTLNRYAFS